MAVLSSGSRGRIGDRHAPSPIERSESFRIARLSDAECVGAAIQATFRTALTLRSHGDLVDHNSVRWSHQQNLILAFHVLQPVQSVHICHSSGQRMQIERLFE